MNISTRELDAIKIVDIEGSLDTNTSPDAGSLLTQLIEQGASKILVNFEKVEYISSAGLRVLLAAAKELKGRGGDLRLCHLNETVQDVFEMSGFSSILSVFKSESEAIEGF